MTMDASPSLLGDPVITQTPGKVILMGEHAAVYGQPALIAAIDLWMTVQVSPSDDGSISLHLGNLDHHETVSWDEVKAYAKKARKQWHAYIHAAHENTFSSILGRDPANLVKIAMGEALLHRNLPADAGCMISIFSEQPIGAGVGSSAALAVGLLNALHEYYGLPLENDSLFNLALNVERRQHGTPSGIDPVTVLRGGVVWAEPDDSGALGFRNVEIASPALSRIQLFHTGLPNESTGDVVDAVRKRRQTSPSTVNALLERMGRLTRQLYRLLQDETQAGPMVECIRAYQACLEDLGVVPAEVRRVVREIEAAGGAAKISGAGTLTGSGAGSLLVYHPEREPEELAEPLQSFEKYHVTLGAAGTRRVASV